MNMTHDEEGKLIFPRVGDQVTARVNIQFRCIAIINTLLLIVQYSKLWLKHKHLDRILLFVKDLQFFGAAYYLSLFQFGIQNINVVTGGRR